MMCARFLQNRYDLLRATVNVYIQKKMQKKIKTIRNQKRRKKKWDEEKCYVSHTFFNQYIEGKYVCVWFIR